jgi:O-acetylhomoserine/O-acetylserine sulfhydrylase-like pyridoxal-dependent enzyme
VVFPKIASAKIEKMTISVRAELWLRQLTDDQLIEAGVPQDLVRISVGIEDIEDILWDLDQALTIATGRGRS